MDESKKRIKNIHIASNIRFLREKKSWSLYEFAKILDGIDTKNAYHLVKRWESGLGITLGNIRRLEAIFKIPKGSLKNPDLPNNYDFFRWYYIVNYEKTDTFESPEEFMRFRNEVIKNASEHPEKYKSVKITYSSSFAKFYAFIQNIGYTDYEYDSADLENLYASTVEFIKRHHERNRPQQ